MKKFFSLFLIMVFVLNRSYCQKNNLEAAMYNIAIGASISSIGALINKNKGEKPFPVIVKGLWQGALGGYVTYESKRIIEPAYIHDDWRLFWTSRLLNAAGTSIKENAALNRDFWEQWNLHLGFLRIELHTKDQFRLRAKALPIASFYTVLALVQTDLELKQSLKIAQWVFSSDDPRFEAGNSTGVVFPGIMVLKKGNQSFPQLQAHEIIHLYQQNDFTIFNSYYQKPIKSLSKRNQIVKKMAKYIYPDLSFYVKIGVSIYERNTSFLYYDNFLEHEAGYYSNTLINNFKVSKP